MAELDPEKRRRLDEVMATTYATLQKKWESERPAVPEPRETYVMEFYCTYSELKDIQLAVKCFCIGRKRCYLKRRGDES